MLDVVSHMVQTKNPLLDAAAATIDRDISVGSLSCALLDVVVVHGGGLILECDGGCGCGGGEGDEAFVTEEGSSLDG